MPVSGYLVMPKDAKAKSLPAEVSFLGYSVCGAGKNLQAGENKIFLNINAHGIKNGEPKEYYEELSKGALKSYAFSKDENASPDTSYFNGMFLRAMRALEFVKSLPEWNGKDLRASGGSQGGLQSPHSRRFGQRRQRLLRMVALVLRSGRRDAQQDQRLAPRLHARAELLRPDQSRQARQSELQAYDNR